MKGGTKMKKGKSVYLIVGILLVILIAGGIFYFVSTRNDETEIIGVYGYYDIDGNPIAVKSGNPITNWFNKLFKQQSIVYDPVTGTPVEGVYFVSLVVRASNTDTIPLNFTITSSTPAAFTTALLSPLSGPSSAASQQVSAGSTGQWISGLISVAPYEGTTQDFSVQIRGIGLGRQPSTNTGVISLKVDPDPFANFEVSIVYS